MNKMDLGYAFANARVKGMKSALLNANSVRELMQISTIDEMTALLEQTSYKGDLVEASKNYEGVQRIDVALNANLARVTYKVWKMLPPSERKKFELLYAEWDAQDFKTVFSKKAAGLEIAQNDLLNVFPQRKAVFERLKKAKDLREALSAAASLWNSPHFKIAMQKILSEKELDFRKAIEEVERERVRRLETLSKNSDSNTKKTVQAILEFQGIMVALRLKKENLPAKEALLFKRPGVKKVIHSKSFEHALEEACKHYGVKDVPASLSKAEIEFEKALSQKILRYSRMSVLSFGTVVGFLFLKQMEVANLRKIAFANYYGLKDEMKELIFAVNK